MELEVSQDVVVHGVGQVVEKVLERPYAIDVYVSNLSLSIQWEVPCAMGRLLDWIHLQYIYKK